MSFKLPEYKEPDFTSEPFISAPDAKIAIVEKSGVAPKSFHATTIFPEYFKINGTWILAKESRMDCVAVVKEGRYLDIKEFRRLMPGEKVITGRSENGSEGIYINFTGFESVAGSDEAFAFRTGRTRETSFSMDYDRLYDLLRYERENGYIVWVLGPAVIFDSDSRKAMSELIENGYVDAVLAGNALATHDLEGSLFRTALGQDIYTKHQMPEGHYNHLDTINMARAAGSLESLIENAGIRDGVVDSCLKNHIPLILTASIRDDGPLPPVIADIYKAQDAMREHTKKATTVLCLATQLHSIAAGNMTPIYHASGDIVRPVFIYTIDISEFAVNKLKDRGSLSVTSIVTNIQDFLVNLQRNLI